MKHSSGPITIRQWLVRFLFVAAVAFILAVASVRP